MAVTMRDIAREANVALSTVSYVLSGNGLHKVGEKTCKRILDTANRMHYRPNLKARSLSKGRTYIVGALFRKLTVSFVPEIIAGLEQVLEDNGYCLILATYDSPQQFTEKCNYLYQHGVEGAVIIPLFNDVKFPDIGELAQDNIPIITIGNELGNFPKVLVEPQAVGKYAFTYLAELGHRRIAYAGCYAPRIKGMLAAHKHHPDVEFNWKDTPLTEKDTGEEILKYITGLPQLPTAVVTDSDIEAISFMHRAFRSGIRIPEDISVVGIDGMEIGAYTNPPLSAVAQPTIEQGRRGGELLLDAINGCQVEDCILQPFILERESCRKI